VRAGVALPARGIAHAGQAEDLHAIELGFDALHQRCEPRLRQAEHQERALFARRAVKLIGVISVEHPLHHRPRHHRKTRHEMVMRHRETGDAVVAVRDDACALRKLAHLEAVLVFGRGDICLDRVTVGRLGNAQRDLLARFRMQLQRHAQRSSCALACVVIGRRADTASAEHHVVAGEGTLEHAGDARGLVADVFRPLQRQAALAEHFDQLAQVFVFAATGENLVADDDHAESHVSSDGF